MKRIILFSFLFLVNVMHAMETSVISNTSIVKPIKIMTLFNPKKHLERVPRAIIITPDHKGILAAVCGAVQQLLFDSEDGVGAKTIIEHPCARKYCPMIAVAQKQNGSLLIVSGGNYKNEDNKDVAEYISLCGECLKVKKLTERIQAISLDAQGKFLAIAGQYFVRIIDLETDQADEVFFQGIDRKENWVVDVAVHMTGSSVIGVGSHNGVQLMSVMKKDNAIDLSILKQVESPDVIRKIYYPTREELLYLTKNGQAKTVNMYDLLEPNDEPLKSSDFSHPSLLYDVAADPSSHVATAHWNNIDRKIKIYRKNNNNCVEKFSLEIDLLEDRYDCITEFGQLGQGTSHILDVAIRGNSVVVLTTDGKIRLWTLPEEHYVCNQASKEAELKVQDNNLHPFDYRPSDSLHIKKNKLSGLKIFTSSFENVPRSPRGKKLTENSPNKRNSLKLDDHQVENKKIDGTDI